MREYVASEQAYKNGYELGKKVKQEEFAEQFASGFVKGFNEDIKPKKHKWKDNLLNTFLKGGYE